MSHDTVLHRMIRPAVRRLARTRVTPDHLTLLRLATGLAAAIGFASGVPLWRGSAAGVFAFSALLDRADGELARQTGQFSRFGHRWDLIADCAATMLAFIGLGVGAARGWLAWGAPTLGCAAAIGVVSLFWQINMRQGRLPAYRLSGRVLADPDDAMLALPIVIWIWGPEMVLLPAGLFTPGLAIWMAWCRATTA